MLDLIGESPLINSPHLPLEKARLPVLRPRRALEVPEVLVRLRPHDLEEGVVVKDALFYILEDFDLITLEK